MRERISTRDCLISGAFLLVTVLFFWKVVFLGEVFYFRDTFKLFYPMKKFMMTAFSQGKLPLWNPFSYNGSPFLADNTTAVLYPLNLLYAILPFDLAFQYLILLHYFLAGVFVYLLLRGWHCSCYAATFAGLAFLLNSYLVQMSGNIIYLAIIWTPLFLWALHRALEKGKSTAGILPGVILAIQFLAGEPQSVYWSLWIGLGYVGYWWVGGLVSRWAGGPTPQQADTSTQRSFFPFLLFVIIGLTALGLAMIQFLPSLEMAWLSERRGGFPYEIAVLWSYHPLRLVEFFIPFFFGNSFHPEQYWGFFLQNFLDGSAWTTSIYSGVLPFLFTILALSGGGRHRRQILFVSVLGGMTLFLAFGVYTPLYYFFFEYMPFFRLFRYPEKYMMLVTLCIPLLAGFGVDYLLGQSSTTSKEEPARQETRRVSWIIRGAGVFSLLFLVGYAGLRWYETECALLIQRAMQGYQNPYLQPTVIVAQIRLSLLFTGCLALASAATLLFWQRKVLSKRSVKVILLALLLLDLFMVSSRVNYTTFPELYTPLSPDTSILRLLQTEGAPLFRIHRDKLFFYDQQDNHSPLSLYERRKLWEKYTLVENIGMNYGIQYLHGYTGYHLARYFDLQQRHLFPRLLNLFNAQYFLVHHKDKIFTDTNRYKTLAVAPWNGLRVVENLQALPRAFWVPQAIILSQKEEILQRLADPAFNPREVVILEGNLPHDMGTPVSDGEAQVTILSYAPEQVRVQVQSPAQGFVVLGDTYYPGWKAFIDGVPTPVLPANYVLRAVAVGAGTQQIDFVYDPWTLKVGALISGVTCLVIGGIWLQETRTGLRHQRGTSG